MCNKTYTCSLTMKCTNLTHYLNLKLFIFYNNNRNTANRYGTCLDLSFHVKMFHNIIPVSLL